MENGSSLGILGQEVFGLMVKGVFWDCHMHSFFSGDSETPTEEMIQEAIRKGLRGVCFTEHLDPDYPEIPEEVDFSLDVPAYRAELVRLQEKYRDKLDIRFGIELGLQPHLAKQFQELVAEVPFDFVIGSSHVVHQADPYYPEFFHGREEATAYREYFESILENLKAFNQMDVYGHLDYIVRYGPNQNREYSYEKYRDVLDEILKQLTDRQIGLELNTGGYHYGLGQPNPSIEVLKRYRELGGEIITVGADAHVPAKIGYAFDAAYAVLKECGFRYYSVFKNRKAEFLSLE